MGLETEALLTWVSDKMGTGMARCLGKADEFWLRLECCPVRGK